MLAVNGRSLSGSSHAEAIASFKSIKQGQVTLTVGRRKRRKVTQHFESPAQPQQAANAGVQQGSKAAPNEGVIGPQHHQPVPQTPTNQHMYVAGKNIYQAPPVQSHHMILSHQGPIQYTSTPQRVNNSPPPHMSGATAIVGSLEQKTAMLKV